jgi:murein DD-endopeptidase MepM/ murein hydrolase activator NlpD
VGYRGNYGKTIIIAHQQGYTTLYGHLDKILVKRGQVVRQGEKIGTMGNSGRSTGPHLHFELRQYHRFLDPLKILHR